MRTLKSAGVRFVMGLPALSTIETSTEVTSTDDLNAGGGCWATTTMPHTSHAVERKARRVRKEITLPALRALRSRIFSVILRLSRDIPAARGPRDGRPH